MTNLTDADRKWIANALTDAFVPYGRDFNAEDGARLIEARMETLLARHVTAALTEAADAIDTRRNTCVQSGGLPELIPSNHADAERLGHLDGLAAAAEIVRALAQPNPIKENQ